MRVTNACVEPRCLTGRSTRAGSGIAPRGVVHQLASQRSTASGRIIPTLGLLGADLRNSPTLESRRTTNILKNVDSKGVGIKACRGKLK